MTRDMRATRTARSGFSMDGWLRSRCRWRESLSHVCGPVKSSDPYRAAHVSQPLIASGFLGASAVTAVGLHAHSLVAIVIGLLCNLHFIADRDSGGNVGRDIISAQIESPILALGRSHY